MSAMTDIPVILDTDIGGDIDDTWALVMLLKSPELDLKLVVSDTGDTVYRAKICAKLLERAGRSDIPVGLGIRKPSDGPRERQKAWVADYDLRQYPGTVLEDGVNAIIETIEAAAQPVTLICIGPAPNIAEVLRRKPEIAAKTNVVGMYGSLERQHHGRPGAIAEFNVVQDIPSCQAIFRVPWKSATITPLDTCGVVQLKGELYETIARSNDPMVRDILENYRIWRNACGNEEACKESSILYDTVAIHLAYSTDFLKMKKMRLRVDDAGFTVIDKAAPAINVAVDWLDLDAYHRCLVQRLLS